MVADDVVKVGIEDRHEQICDGNFGDVTFKTWLAALDDFRNWCLREAA
jgi:hypothetical protein